jgi:hypothetical protein
MSLFSMENWTVSDRVMDMSEMFAYISGADTEIDLTDWAEPSSGCNLENMFYCYYEDGVTIKGMEKFIRED